MAKKYKNMKDVAAAVEENGNLTTASLLELREALDFKRLGVGVLSTIERELDSEGLGYFPEWVLDGDQNTSPRAGHEVRVYKKRSAVGDIVSAVLDPTNRGDERLREGAGGEAAETLKQIRELLS